MELQKLNIYSILLLSFDSLSDKGFHKQTAF